MRGLPPYDVNDWGVKGKGTMIMREGYTGTLKRYATYPTLAVHVHLYRGWMWKKIRSYLQHMGDYPYDLYVTIPREEESIATEVCKFREGACVWILEENRGYDIAPFLDFLRRIKLKRYDLVMKLHTKDPRGEGFTCINQRMVSRHWWVRLLFEGVLGSEQVFMRNMERFKNMSALGMVGSHYLISSDVVNSTEVEAKVRCIMKRLGCPDYQRILFVPGTMFIARTDLLQPIAEHYETSDFEVSNGQVKDGTLAHAMERVFGVFVDCQGYKIEGYDRKVSYELTWRFSVLKRFIFRKKITHRGYLLIKICKLPVVHLRMNMLEAHRKGYIS